MPTPKPNPNPNAEATTWVNSGNCFFCDEINKHLKASVVDGVAPTEMMPVAWTVPGTNTADNSESDGYWTFPTFPYFPWTDAESTKRVTVTDSTTHTSTNLDMPDPNVGTASAASSSVAGALASPEKAAIGQGGEQVVEVDPDRGLLDQQRGSLTGLWVEAAQLQALLAAIL